MKKILGIAVLSLLFFGNISNAGSKWGEGELQLTKGVVDYFIQFIRGKGNKSPADFYVTLDGTDAMYWYCSNINCRPGSAVQDIKACKRQTKKKCKKFAYRRTIKWNNGINPAQKKTSTINSKWSDTEIYAKLTELGFYNNDLSKKVEPKITNKVKKSTNTDKGDIVSQLKDLKELLDASAINQEEFDKAKKKLLN
jgi:hypothetical protein